jgi:hemolysin activation/secretion protein
MSPGRSFWSYLLQLLLQLSLAVLTWVIAARSLSAKTLDPSPLLKISTHGEVGEAGEKGNEKSPLSPLNTTPYQPDKQVNQPTFSRSGTESTTEGGEIQESITVTAFKFTGNTETAISTEELEELVAGLTNQPLLQSEFPQIAAKVAQLYANKGYNSSGAEIVIPDDTRLNQKGVVEIQVIEDELEQIKIIPGDILGVNENYLRSRLELAASKPLNVHGLKQSLQHLQLDPLIEAVSAELSPGSHPGKKILEVKVAEADSGSPQHSVHRHSPNPDSVQHRPQLNGANLLVLTDQDQASPNPDNSTDGQIVPTLNLAQVRDREIPTTPPPQDVVPLPASPAPVPQAPTVPSVPLENQLPFPPSPGIAPEPVPETVPERIIVEQFEFSGNTVFTSEALAEKIQVCISAQSPQQIQIGTSEDLAEICQEPSVQKPLAAIPHQGFSLTQLLQIAATVAKLYANQGYSTSGAEVVIPEETQLNRQGVVEIQVIEGKLEEITIIPGDRLGVSEGYVRSRLQLAAEQPLNVEGLKQGLQLLLLDPLIEDVSARLSPGSRPGNSILEVEVEGANSFSPQVSLDNSRSPSVGSFQRRSRLSLANLLISADRISAGYSNSDGSDALEFSYRLPLNPGNGTAEFAYNQTESDVIEPPFNDIDNDGSSPDIESASRSYEVTLRQPISQRIKNGQTFEEFALGLTASLRDSETFVLDIPFALSPGADEDGHIRLFALRFFQEWTRQNPREALAFRSQFNVGLDAFNSTTNEPIAETGEAVPDSRFFSWQVQGQWVRILAPDTLLLLRGNVQLADQTLLSSEQLAVGGLGSVRGYRQDTLLTDNGVFASAEVWLPILRLGHVQDGSSQEGVLQVIPFLDYGTTWNSSDRDNPEPKTLSSVGIGLQWRQDNLTARLDWGIPLVSVDSRDRTWQENGLYFSVQWNPSF